MLITIFKHLLNKVAFACRPDTPGERTHLVFLSLGLRHLVVVEEDSHVAGMVTRKDLDYAAGFGPWRRNKQVPKAHALSTLATRSSRHLTDTIFAVCNTLTSQFSSPGPIDDSGKASRDSSCRSMYYAEQTSADLTCLLLLRTDILYPFEGSTVSLCQNLCQAAIHERR